MRLFHFCGAGKTICVVGYSIVSKFRVLVLTSKVCSRIFPAARSGLSRRLTRFLEHCIRQCFCFEAVIVSRCYLSSLCFASPCGIIQHMSLLLALAAVPGMLGTQEAIRQGQQKERREEHRARRCNLIVRCIKSSQWSRELDGRPLVLRNGAVRIGLAIAAFWTKN